MVQCDIHVVFIKDYVFTSSLTFTAVGAITTVSTGAHASIHPIIFYAVGIVRTILIHSTLINAYTNVVVIQLTLQ